MGRIWPKLIYHHHYNTTALPSSEQQQQSLLIALITSTQPVLHFAHHETLSFPRAIASSLLLILVTVSDTNKFNGCDRSPTLNYKTSKFTIPVCR